MSMKLEKHAKQLVPQGAKFLWSHEPLIDLDDPYLELFMFLYADEIILVQVSEGYDGFTDTTQVHAFVAFRGNPETMPDLDEQRDEDRLRHVQ